MQVKELELSHFRNYDTLALGLKPGVNVLCGENGRGKTNILESIYLCTCASSHRTSRDKELIKQGETDYRVKLSYINDQEHAEQLDIHYMEAVNGDPLRKKNRRLVRHNGLQLERIGHLMGLFNAVIFSPEDMRMIKDGPQIRRRFMDLLISQIKPLYFGKLQQFNVILNQRNKLLKHLRDGGYRPVPAEDGFDLRGIELDTWDERFAELAADIIYWREHFAEILSGLAAESHLGISGGKEVLSIQYLTIKALSDRPYEEYKAVILGRLQHTRGEDIKRGTTSVGPHRDDLEIKLDGMPIRLFGSQGQQRTAVLAFKIAELRLIEQATKNRPVLLLDDVMSELDVNRRESLVSHMKDCQVLLTCTEADLVSRQIDLLKETTEVTVFGVGDGSARVL